MRKLLLSLLLLLPLLAQAQFNPANSYTLVGNVCGWSGFYQANTYYSQTGVVLGAAIPGCSASASAAPVTVKSANNGFNAHVNYAGEQLVTTEGSVLFIDTFDASFNTATNWNAAVSAGGGVGESWVAGTISLGTGTTANGYAYVTTQPTFTLTQPGFIQTGISVQVPALYTNGYAAWGTFTPTATPTAASPIQEGCGFEIAITQKMYVVCYAGAVRAQIQDLSSATGNHKQPLDASMHRYMQWQAGGLMYWAIDYYDNVVASQPNGANGPNLNTQPAAILTAAGSTGPTSSMVVNIGAVWVADTAHNNFKLSDGATPWRFAQVSSNNALKTENNSIYSHISTVATTVVKTGAGNLHTITVNQLGTVASLVTCYDNTAASGTVILSLNSLTFLGTATYDVGFTAGLTCATTGTAAPDITISYR